MSLSHINELLQKHNCGIRGELCCYAVIPLKHRGTLSVYESQEC